MQEQDRLYRERKAEYVSANGGNEIDEITKKKIVKEIRREMIGDELVAKRIQNINLLENKIKNVVIRKIVKIRETNQKKTIRQAVEQIVAQN